MKGLKEQKDQYRLYHINQDIQALQKMLSTTLLGLKYFSTI